MEEPPPRDRDRLFGDCLRPEGGARLRRRDHRLRPGALRLSAQRGPDGRGPRWHPLHHEHLPGDHVCNLRGLPVLLQHRQGGRDPDCGRAGGAPQRIPAGGGVIAMKADASSVLYRDPARTADERADDLLARMTLEEKVAQMLCIWQQKSAALVDERGRFDMAKAEAYFASGHGIGQVGRPSDAGGGLTARQMAETTNDIQRFFVERSRLGIPVIFHEECLHGHAAREGTSFPQPIGLGATFDPELVERLYTMTAAEARARGTHQALTPVVDVAREPRWGRVEETFGEDPYLVARMGVAAVRGFQGDQVGVLSEGLLYAAPAGLA